MGWNELRELMPRFDEALQNLNLTIPAGSPIKMQHDTVRGFLTDQASMPEQDLATKCHNGQFKQVHDAAIVVYRLARAVVALHDQPRKRLKSTLKTVLAGRITQDFEPSSAKDFFYELDVAFVLQRAGFIVTLREPDIVVQGNGLSRELGLACKYPSSVAQIHGHISKGYKQLTGQNLPGVVAFGMDLIVFRAAFDRPPHFLDFRQSEKTPLVVAQTQLDREIVQLVGERPSKYPSEEPLDGALLSLNMWGAYGKPVSITEVTAWTFQCDVANLLRSDLITLVNALTSSP